MEGIKCNDKIRNVELLRRVGEDTAILKTMDKRKINSMAPCLRKKDGWKRENWNIA